MIETLVTDWPDNPLVAASLSGLRMVQPPSDDEYLEGRKAGLGSS